LKEQTDMKKRYGDGKEWKTTSPLNDKSKSLMKQNRSSHKPSGADTLLNLVGKWQKWLGGLEMNKKEYFKMPAYVYVLFILATALALSACGRSDEIPPTPIDPTATPYPAPGSISGVVWNDECLNGGDTSSPGCVRSAGDNSFVGDGKLDEGESGIGAAQVLIGAGICPSEGLAQTRTREDGSFNFPNLDPGEYCITVKDPEEAQGYWTYPLLDKTSKVSWTTITVKSGQVVSNVNFGWDFLDQLPPTPIDPTATPEPICSDQAQFIGDVSIPDGTRLDPGDSFTKTWRFRNSGTCTWTKDYAIVHMSGHSLHGPNAMTLPAEVEPGEVIDISLSLKAPMTNGSYTGWWKFRNDANRLFGIGDEASSSFWASIEVGPEPEPVFPDWRGEYFSNKNLDGKPAFLKNDRTLDKTWGLRSPNEDYLPRDNFSVRWTRELEFSERIYRFYLDITDGGKLYIDDVLVLNEWADGERRTVTVDVALKKGKHEIKFEYYNAYGGAVAQLWYEAVKDAEYEGWKTKYWMNKSMNSDLVVIRDEGEINFDWGDDGPIYGGRSDKFSVQWKRSVAFEAGLYSLRAMADDGIRVFVDGALVIDEWHNSAGNDIYTVQLELSGLHEITVQYYENAGKAKVNFEWELIEPANHAPEAVDDAYSVSQEEVLDVLAPGLLANDVDPDGDALMLALKIAPSNGSLELRVDGSFVYTPEEGFTGEDSFGYVVSDGQEESELGTVLITVLPVGEE
jgi:hypothetical protein